MAQLFGEKLRALRHQHGLTQSELAHRLGLTAHSHIAKLEANQDAASLNLVLRVAYAFNVTLDYLLRDSWPVETVAPTLGSELIKSVSKLGLFNTKLRTLREKHGLSQIELARRLGLARRGYVSNLETGRKAPSLELVVSIADLFSVTVDYLFRDEEAISSTSLPKAHD